MTILSARYAKPDNTAAFVDTDDLGRRLISAADHPEKWADLLTKIKPEPYEAPPEPEPVVPPLKGEWDSASTQTAKLTVLAKALGLAD